MFHNYAERKSTLAPLTREERETCLLINDLGEITIWSVSPIWIKKLTKRLGKPDYIDGETSFWNFTSKQATFPLPSKRKAPTEAQREAGRRLAQSRSKPTSSLGKTT